jgi:hypothetical protein
MDIRNYDEIVEEYIPNEKVRNKNPLAPQWPFRFLVVAASGSGKTNMVVNLIMEHLDFDRVYIFAPDLTEPKYVYLIGTLKAMEQRLHEVNGGDEQIVFFGDKPEDIPDVNDLDPDFQNLVIIDDSVINKKANEKVSELFIRGRKRNASIIYQTQSFFHVPKLMRLQANYVALFSVAGAGELREICKHFATQVDYNEFKKLFKQCTDRPFSFMLLDLKTSKVPMKIRCGFDGLYSPEPVVTDAETGEELRKKE